VSEYAEIQSVYDPATISQAEQQEQASVLRFKTNNVTHVIIAAGDWEWMAGSWIKHAQGQQYFPRYGLNSSTGGNTVDYTGADIRPSMKGAINVGWTPQLDVDNFSPTPRAKLCSQIVAKAGFNTATQQSTQLACQYLFFIKDGLDAAPELNARGFAAGLAKLGTLPGVLTQATRFNGRRDGPAVIQTSRYVASCDCWQYYGPRLPF
jgi:hypothetical protein